MSRIEWTEMTWNPVTGCSKVSEGCRNCYAERMAKRLQAMGNARYVNGFRVTLHDDLVDLPRRMRQPRLIFVNSMSDLFHENVPVDFIRRVFRTMGACPQHTFQVLTKRPERAAKYLAGVRDITEGLCTLHGDTFPLSNVWLGTSIEDQATLDARIPHLLQCLAQVRFLSCEPLLGPVTIDFEKRYYEQFSAAAIPPGGRHVWNPRCVLKQAIHWVIVGGESGPYARPMHPNWVRSIRDQCVDAGVPFFFKQWGAWKPYAGTGGGGSSFRFADGTVMRRMCKKANGRLLDGRMWDEMPASAGGE